MNMEESVETLLHDNDLDEGNERAVSVLHFKLRIFTIVYVVS